MSQRFAFIPLDYSNKDNVNTVKGELITSSDGHVYIRQADGSLKSKTKDIEEVISGTINVSTVAELEAAIDSVKYKRMVGDVTIQIADGTYDLTKTITFEDQYFERTFKIQGNLKDPEAVVLNTKEGYNGINVYDCSGQIPYIGGFKLVQPDRTDGIITWYKRARGVNIGRRSKLWTIRRIDAGDGKYNPEAPSIICENFDHGFHAEDGSQMWLRAEARNCSNGFLAYNNSKIDANYCIMSGRGRRPDTGDAIWNYHSGQAFYAHHSQIHCHYSKVSNTRRIAVADFQSQIWCYNDYDPDYVSKYDDTLWDGYKHYQIQITDGYEVFNASKNSFIYARGNVIAKLEEGLYKNEDGDYVNSNSFALIADNNSEVLAYRSRYTKTDSEGTERVQNAFNNYEKINIDRNFASPDFLTYSTNGSIVTAHYIQSKGFSILARAYLKGTVEIDNAQCEVSKDTVRSDRLVYCDKQSYIRAESMDVTNINAGSIASAIQSSYIDIRSAKFNFATASTNSDILYAARGANVNTSGISASGAMSTDDLTYSPAKDTLGNDNAYVNA